MCECVSPSPFIFSCLRFLLPTTTAVAFLLSFLHCASFIVPLPLSPKNVHFAINVRYSRLPAQLVCLNTQPTVQLDSTRLSRHANFEIGADLPKLPLEAIPFCQILSLSLSSMTLLVRDTKTEEMEESMMENTKGKTRKQHYKNRLPLAHLA